MNSFENNRLADGAKTVRVRGEIGIVSPDFAQAIKCLRERRKRKMCWPEAIETIGREGTLRHVPLLHRLYEEESDFIRIYVVEALGNLRDKKSLPLLKKAAICDDPLVRAYACSSIGWVGTKRDISFLKRRLGEERNGLVKCHIYGGVKSLGIEDIDGMLSLLKSKRYLVRCAVCNNLRNFDSQKNKGKILRALGRLREREPRRSVAVREAIDDALRYFEKKRS
jgi:hypothetical protein